MNKIIIILLMCVSCLMLVYGNALASQKAEANSTADSTLTQVDNSINNSRQFVNPGGIPFPQTNGFFTSPTPDSSFRSVRDWFRSYMGPGKYMLYMTEGVLESMAKGGDVKSNLQIMRSADSVPRIYTDKYKGIRWLWIAIEKPIIKDSKVIGTKRINDLVVTAMVDGEADDADTNSLQVIGKAGLKALSDGNNFMVITAEGAHRKVESSGVGIGFYVSGGTVSESGKSSGTTGGGTGWSKNESGPEDRPWIQGYVGVKNMPVPVITKHVMK